MTEEDTWWRSDRRETWDDIHHRVKRFLAWLVEMPQNNIVVVSHGVWIEALFRSHGVELNTRVYNADAFACECVSIKGVFGRIQGVRQIRGHGLGK